MENEFLHKINVDAIVKETNLTLDEIARLAGITEARNLGKWSQDKSKCGSRPNYNAIVRLMEKRATAETLLGVSSGVTPPQQTAKNISAAELARFFADVAKGLENGLNSQNQ